VSRGLIQGNGIVFKRKLLDCQRGDQTGKDMGRIAALYRFPVKGFSPQPLARVDIEAAAGFPKDRFYVFSQCKLPAAASTYEAEADGGQWDRAALECPLGAIDRPRIAPL
jgi:hypothetical protein